MQPLSQYRNEYAVTREGRVVSLKYGKTRILKPAVSGRGYSQVSLMLDGKVFKRYVHHLMVEGWVSGVPSGMQVNHMDGNKLNNAIDNLEVCTPAGNMRHAVAAGLQSSGRKISGAEREAIVADILSAMRPVDVMRRHGVSDMTYYRYKKRAGL